MKSILGIVKTELENINVPYEFMRWTKSTNPDRYWIGEYSETPTDTEDGYEESTLLLTGTTKGSWLSLEDDKAKIKDHFPSVYGLRKATDDGAVVIFYENAFPVDTGEADLKRIQINLKIKKWRGIDE